ncbi:MAG: DUF1489 domain-containing protein [Pseudomonadota bacterium]
MTIHLLKVAVGAETVEDLIERQKAWHVTNGAGETIFRVRTRQTPRRQDELLAGGSLYWIIKGFVRARQRILAFEPTVIDGRDHMLIHLEEPITKTQLHPRGPHQGWRYLKPEASPADLEESDAVYESMPPKLLNSLKELALL